MVLRYPSNNGAKWCHRDTNYTKNKFAVDVAEVAMRYSDDVLHPASTAGKNDEKINRNNETDHLFKKWDVNAGLGAAPAGHLIQT